MRKSNFLARLHPEAFLALAGIMLLLMAFSMTFMACSSNKEDDVYRTESPAPAPAQRSSSGDLEKLKSISIGFAQTISTIADTIGTAFASNDTVYTICIDGYTYYRFHDCITPKLDRVGYYVPCRGNSLPVKGN